MPDPRLVGVGVLVTRPRGQSSGLVEAVEAAGGEAIQFPVLDIVARDPVVVESELAAGNAGLTIFISSNAVEHGLRYAEGRLVAIGPATRAAIEAAGRTVDVSPASGFDTEHLLAEPAFDDIEGLRIRIVRGVGGREKLARELAARGAEVEYVEAYERRLPDYTANVLADVDARWRRGEIGAVVVMSVESLRNLAALLPDASAALLPQTLLVSPAERVIKEALDHYPGCPAVLAAGTHPGDIVDAILAASDSRIPRTNQ